MSKLASVLVISTTVTIVATAAAVTIALATIKSAAKPASRRSN